MVKTTTHNHVNKREMVMISDLLIKEPEAPKGQDQLLCVQRKSTKATGCLVWPTKIAVASVLKRLAKKNKSNFSFSLTIISIIHLFTLCFPA